ncbi:MAG: hypothetical protein CMK07_10235, partial [Ponticaulis sp.]|nr:hypothetical protein [Ponticaulis sp.]
YGWTVNGLKQGGYGWITLIHEFGHGLGLAHPHDDGGTSTIMAGVSNSGDTGLHGLNQGVYTTMSYIDGWEESPYGTPTGANFGYQATAMALDIAMLQEKYGANVTNNDGNTVYRLPLANESGTYWSSIWDVGGTDTVHAAQATVDVVIDLRPASIQYEVGGGGFLSYAYGIHGGFSVANGVEIENATSGAGDDELTGNHLNNRLSGRAGIDILYGLDGDDRLYGGSEDDTLIGGPGADKLYGGSGDNRYEFAEGDSLRTSADMIYGFNVGDVISLGAHTFIGDSAFSGGGATEVRAIYNNGRYRLDIDRDGDGTLDERIWLQQIAEGLDVTSDGTDIGLEVTVASTFQRESPDATDVEQMQITDFGFNEWTMIS